MKSIFAWVLLFLALGHFTYAEGNKTPVVLGVVDRHSREDFEKKVFPTLKLELDKCAICSLQNFSPYNEKGEYQAEALPEQIELAATKAQILLFNFNEKTNSANKKVTEALNQAVAKGLLIVGKAGGAPMTENSAPLSQTVVGPVSGALIIGELGSKERLVEGSFFGPEMLTALRPPKDLLGQDLAAVLFAGNLSREFHKRNNWNQFLKEKKIASRKIFLELRDCF